MTQNKYPIYGNPDVIQKIDKFCVDQNFIATEAVSSMMFLAIDVGMNCGISKESLIEVFTNMFEFREKLEEIRKKKDN
jgi:hypothetical protein